MCVFRGCTCAVGMSACRGGVHVQSGCMQGVHVLEG